MTNPGPGQGDSTWWWKAAVSALFAMLAGLLTKGCTEWQQTNTALTQLTSDVKYQIDRVGERERRLIEVEKRMSALNEAMQANFEARRALADRLVNEIDDRLDRLEQMRDPQGLR